MPIAYRRRKALELALGERRGVDLDTTFGAAEGHIDDGALEGHVGRECHDLMRVDGLVEADPAFAGASGAVVVHPPARERPRSRRCRAG